ncbi:uncharacterized protein At3g28850-like [Cucurbita pepo subsp. pepo]|uniref:uncharacterized protein At3g28850-like n=1 Tax=Cucurbita pepo subsp. pepo TaxID=3664 RepID=UPI000C9D7232|nr:uncharacterized protein At3g28850-like [Cucurbita pepo subsp. pepo]
MGCAISKQKRCPHCRNSLTQRTNSLHPHQSPPRHSDGYHVLAFSSSTLGSLKLENIHFDNKIYTTVDEPLQPKNNETKNQVSMSLIDAKTWSNMINKKIPKIPPKTPIITPPGEPETINVWEVMEGLDDITPFRPTSRPRSFSFDLSTAPPCDSSEQGISNSNSNLQEFDDSSTSPKPFCLQNTELDTGVISPIRRSLEEHPPEEETSAETVAGDPPEGKNREKVVVYFTSLRGVRKTYEDCCDVRMILKSMGARVDERDVSMDSGFKQELKELLGEGFNGGGYPRVFVGATYIGGAEEIRRLHEDGELDKVLEGCEKVEEGGEGDGGGCCEGCGDVRFVPCETCCGSCKIYCEEGEEEEEEEEEEGGFQRCPDCNENGLIRCPICCG